MHPGLERRVRAALPRLRLFWAAMLGTSLGCAGLGMLASPFSSPMGEAPAPLKAAAALGVVSAAAALLLDRAILAPGQVAARVPLPDPDLALRYLLAGHLALWSLAALPAILGLANLLLGGSLQASLALCAVSLGILALLAPTRTRIATRLEAVVRPPGPVGKP